MFGVHRNMRLNLISTFKPLVVRWWSELSTGGLTILFTESFILFLLQTIIASCIIKATHRGEVGS